MRVKLSQLTFREGILIALLFLLATCMAWYFMLWLPLSEALGVAQTRLQQAEHELAERQQWQVQSTESRVRLEQLAAACQELQAQLDRISYKQDLIDYLADLARLTHSQIHSLAITEDQVSLHIASPTYALAKDLLAEIENSPNLVPISVTFTEDGRVGYNMQLQARVTWGQGPPPNTETYDRDAPWGRWRE